jgi:hypothetical protein
MWSTFIETFKPDYWESIPPKIAIGAMAGLMIFIVYAMTAWGWVPLLSGTTLLIHEAGHSIIGLVMGERMMIYGGTIFQLMFPLVFAWHFGRQRHAMGYLFAWVWEASSFKNVAIYAADARLQALPLVGNGDRIHDWNDILGRWGLLNADQFVGFIFASIAWVIIAGAAWLMVRLWIESK